MPSAPPQWKTFNLLDSASLREVRSVTSSVQGGLNAIKEIMDTVDDILNTVQSFMQVLKLIESIADRGIMAFLDAFINTVESLMDSVRSTGLYGLDLFSYHFKEFPLQYSDDSFLSGNEWWRSGLSTTISKTVEEQRKAEAKQYSILLEKVKSINAKELAAYTTKLQITIQRLQKGYAPNDTDKVNLKELEKTIRNLPKEYYELQSRQIRDALELIFLWKYKSETYYEWIDVICQAFVDPQDKPGKPILSLMNRTVEQAASGTKQEELRHNATPKITTLNKNEFPAIFKSGRPLFSEGDYMKVILVGFCVPSLDSIKDIWRAMKAIPDIVQGAASSTMTSFDGFKTAAENYGNKWNQLLKRVGADFDFAADVATYGEEPNFFGLTLDIFLRDIFRYIELLMERLRGFNIPLTSSIFDNIDSVITSIKQWVAFAQYILNIVEELNKFIEALLVLSQGFILNFDTNDGVPGVIQALKTTKPFTTVKMNLNKILSAFNLQGNSEALLAISNNASTIPEMIANVEVYRQNTVFQYNEAQVQYAAADEKYREVEAKHINQEVIFNQSKAFETAIEASEYHTLVETTEAEILARDDVIASYINLMNSELTCDGSRQWISDQIVLCNEELDPSSAFNVVNAQAQANVQAQIDALDAQYADPYGPVIPDYTAQRAALVAQKDLLIQLKSEHDALYTDKRDRYIAVQDIINAFVDAHPVTTEADLAAYDLRISQLETEITDLKSGRDDVYQQYLDDVDAAEQQISDDKDAIQTKQSQISVLNGQIAGWQAEKTYWQAVDPIGHAARIVELQGYIDDANDDITTLEGEITALQADIVTQTELITTLNNDQASYDETAVSTQEDRYTEMTAYIHWRRAEDYRVIELGLTEELETYITTQDEAITSLVDGLIADTMPCMTDPTYASTLSSLYYDEGFDTTFPDSSRVQNAMAKITNSGGALEAAEIPREIAASELTYCDSVLAKLPEEFVNQTINELLSQTEEEFNPNEKMYYGGFLVCFGMPTTQSFTDSATDMYAMASEKVKVTGGKAESVQGPINSLRQDALSIFKKIFK